MIVWWRIYLMRMTILKRTLLTELEQDGKNGELFLAFCGMNPCFLIWTEYYLPIIWLSIFYGKLLSSNEECIKWALLEWNFETDEWQGKKKTSKKWIGSWLVDVTIVCNKLIENCCSQPFGPIWLWWVSCVHLFNIQVWKGLDDSYIFSS